MTQTCNYNALKASMTLEQAESRLEYYRNNRDQTMDEEGRYHLEYLVARDIVSSEYDRKERVKRHLMGVNGALERCYEANRWGNRNE